MKKLIIAILVMFIYITPTYAVEFERCIDGDTAKFIVDEEEVSVRFLAIDTPEYTTKKEVYGKEASEFVCEALNNAKKIELEYDPDSDKEDKYGRLLAWIWVDGSLLQKDIIDEGLAEVAYLYGDYLYTEELQKAELIAKENELNIWSGVDPEGIDDTSNEEETDDLEITLSTLLYLMVASLLINILLYFYYSSIGKPKSYMKIIVSEKSVLKRMLMLIVYSALLIPTMYELSTKLKKITDTAKKS